jgi:hypothetical protein
MITDNEGKEIRSIRLTPDGNFNRSGPAYFFFFQASNSARVSGLGG